MPRTAAEYSRLRALGIPVTSLTDLWLSANAARVLAVTGTKGKSTTSSLAQHLLNSLGISASLVGNGGIPLTDGETAGASVDVTEVSSYQAAEVSTSPRVAIITSLYPEHLPWHGGFEQYVADKLNLVAHGPEVVVVPDLSGYIAGLNRLGAQSKLIDPSSIGLGWSEAGIAWAGVGMLGTADIPIHGLHNLANAVLAITAVAVGFNVPKDRWSELLTAPTTFLPLAHRLETVPSNDGRRWVDDSLATAPEAVVAALETYPNDRVTLVLGGADRASPSLPSRLPSDARQRARRCHRGRARGWRDGWPRAAP